MLFYGLIIKFRKIKDFYSAGLETTNNSLGFFIAYVAVKPEIQKKLYEELDSLIGRELLPSLDHKHR